MDKGQDDHRAPGDSRIKFLVIASDCQEARLAAFFAGRRAKCSNARVTVLCVPEHPGFAHWASVTETMRAEIMESARILMDEFSSEIEAQTGEIPERIIREGRPKEEIRNLIRDDSRIAVLVLGASGKAGSPGPLVSELAGVPTYFGTRPIPVMVVPGSVSREELRRLSG